MIIVINIKIIKFFKYYKLILIKQLKLKIKEFKF